MATRDIGALRTRLSWEDEGANRSLEGFKRDLKGLRSEMRLAQSGGKDYTNSLKGMREQSDVLSRRFKTQQQQVRELKRRYEESKAVKGEDAVQTQNLAAQYNRAAAEMNNTENQLKNLNNEIRRMESPWTKLGEKMTNTGQKMQDFGRGMTDFGKSYTLRVTTPIVAGGTAMVKAAIDYESAFAGVRKTVDMSEEGYAKLSRGIRDMAKELPTSAVDIAAVAESAGQLGIKNESILGFTRTIIDLGEATNMTREQAATEFARFANIVGMPQDAFDRLGSSVVQLGNNMATTESEIVRMGMRLAAQGSLVGMSEAQIMALAATMSSLGIEAEAGGTAMTMVLKKIETAVDEGGEAVAGFAKAAGVSSKEFSEAWKNDPINALDLFIKGLSDSSNEGENLTSILSDLGIKGIRESDTILRLAGASDLLSEAVENSTSAWEENSALSDEAAERYATTESQLRILWNRVKDVSITLGEAMVPALMEVLNATEPLIQKIEEGAQSFADMDEEQQRNILKLIAFAAAIGPVSVGLGGLTTAVGGVLKIGGSLATMLGKAGGAGLIGRIGLLGVSGPVGWAIAGITALTTTLYLLHNQSKENTADVVDSIKARHDEINTLDDLIVQYEKLKDKNKLSSDEVLRYMDIMSELENAKTEEAIAKLSKEQENLLEKSGMTNEEMTEFLGLNDQIVEKTPSKVQAISEQGNAYINMLEAVKELNSAEKQRLADDTYVEITDRLNDHKKNLEDQWSIQREIKELENNRSSAITDMSSVTSEIKDKDSEILELRNKINNATGEESIKLSEKLVQLEDEKLVLDSVREKHDQQIDRIDKQIGKKNDSLKKTEDEINAFNDLSYEYEAIILSQVDLNAERGEGINKIDDEIAKLMTNKRRLKENTDVIERNTDGYRNQVNEIDDQISKLQGARGELQQVNSLASKDVYSTRNRGAQAHLGLINETRSAGDRLNSVLGKNIDKNLSVNQTPSTGKLDRDLSRPVTKRVNVSVAGGIGGALAGIGYADGTPPGGHKGGNFLAGEEGWELGRMGNRWEMLNFGLYDRPRGYEVFTHDESKKIVRALNNIQIPGYATGARSPGEANRVINDLNQPVSTVNFEGLFNGAVFNVRNDQDIKDIAKQLHDYIRVNARKTGVIF
ncbi:phage tail tape measure protein [Gracilibacillus alcaliphilus]|uniref:phage tail tape measure protein n=1 Tax=Gracilibacillus alcaliphilus TaxID=1401441 RepID=UPI00195B032D|nr:phage tail tape measure protein [Gracilibacillus alcaliphilus]MBM7678375.1 TP901 family phage tail tape measure protein [Gracilibacillus alcaliphilus]